MSKLLNVSKRRRFKRRSRVQPTVEEKAERQERLDKLLSNAFLPEIPIISPRINIFIK